MILNVRVDVRLESSNVAVPQIKTDVTVPRAPRHSFPLERRQGVVSDQDVPGFRDSKVDRDEVLVFGRDVAFVDVDRTGPVLPFPDLVVPACEHRIVLDRVLQLLGELLGVLSEHLGVVEPLSEAAATPFSQSRRRRAESNLVVGRTDRQRSRVLGYVLLDLFDTGFRGALDLDIGALDELPVDGLDNEVVALGPIPKVVQRGVGLAPVRRLDRPGRLRSRVDSRAERSQLLRGARAGLSELVELTTNKTREKRRRVCIDRSLSHASRDLVDHPGQERRTGHVENGTTAHAAHRSLGRQLLSDPHVCVSVPLERVGPLRIDVGLDVPD